MRAGSHWFLVGMLIVAMSISCGKNNDNNGSNNTTGTNNATQNNSNNETTSNNDLDMGSTNNGDDMGGLSADRSCDSLNDGHCMMPFPSNAFLVPDENRASGYQLTFGPETLPVNTVGSYIDPEPYGRLDGFGISAPATVLFPNVDSTGFPTEYTVAESMSDDAPILFLEIDDAGNATRIPYYVDHDLQTTDPSQRALIVRPAVILKPATRYAVAFRGLQTTDGTPIEPSGQFQKLLDGDTADDANLFYRQDRFDELFTILEAEGAPKDELTLAWDWMTASSDSLHNFMLHMREEAFATAGADGPALTITSVEEFTPAENADAALHIQGTFEAPNYITQDGALKKLNLGADDLPEPAGTRTVDFWMLVPQSAIDGNPHGLMFYGHGLFGSGDRAWASFNARIANSHDLIVYGASLWGMSETQEDNDAFAIVADFSKFPAIGDQLHQGFVEWLLLARAAKAQFGGLTEITDRNVTVNTDEMFYSGISQGGIFGPTMVALSPEISLGHAGVPGHTYSTLLHRSVDFEEFFAVMRESYPSPVEQVMALNTVQLLWDQTDSVSYMRHLSAEPFDSGDQNQMLFAPAKGDFQVAVTQNEVLARTEGLGVALMESYDTERTVDLVTPAAYPHNGSAVVLYDFEGFDGDMSMSWRNAWPPPGNLPPKYGDQSACDASCPVGEKIDRAAFGCCHGQCCFDPHELPRRRDRHNEQMVHFFRNGGEVIDVVD